jgi:hypothetical protein
MSRRYQRQQKPCCVAGCEQPSESSIGPAMHGEMAWWLDGLPLRYPPGPRAWYLCALHQAIAQKRFNVPMPTIEDKK